MNKKTHWNYYKQVIRWSGELKRFAIDCFDDDFPSLKEAKRFLRERDAAIRESPIMQSGGRFS